MKYIRLFPIIGVALLASCAKGDDVAPAISETDDIANKVYVEVGVTAGADTKVSYDENLKAYWEDDDRIMAVQGSASSDESATGGGTKYAYGSSSILSLKEFVDSRSKAIFGGDIEEKDTAHSRYFHFAYPVSDVQLVTTTILKRLLAGTFSTTTTCTYTVPAEQDGKWTPFLCASTSGLTTATNIGGVDFGSSLNAAFGVRVFESDKTTPKKIKRIEITAGNNIVGTISATTADNGNFYASLFGSGVSASGNTITADNLQDMDKVGDYYEYRFEVLPVESGEISLTLYDETGSVVTRKAASKTFKANVRSGVNVYWDEASVSMDAPLSWYEDTSAGKVSDLEVSTIYANNIKVTGVGNSGLSEVGVYIDGTKYARSDGAALAFDMALPVSTSGKYAVKAYAVLTNGMEVQSAEQNVVVTGRLTVKSFSVRSSYTENGAVNKTNDFSGDVVKASTSLSDDYAAKNLVESAKLFYGNNTLAIDALGTEYTSGAISPSSWGEYDKCYVEVTFGNGYSVKSAEYKTVVTGVPYDKTLDSATPTDWSTSNTTTSNDCLLIQNNGYIISPAFFATSDYGYYTSVSAQVYCYRGSLTSATYTLSIKTDPAGTASLSENLSGGTATNSFSTKTIYPELTDRTKVRIDATQVSTRGLSAISYGIKVKSLSVRYN